MGFGSTVQAHIDYTTSTELLTLGYLFMKGMLYYHCSFF